MGINVFIYDDNTLFRQSVVLLLESSDIEVSLAKENPISAVEDIKKHNPDVVLMDIDMPKINGVEAVKNIRAENIEIPIIMLTVFDDNDNIFDAICAGASGYLLKRNVSEEIHGAIKMVLNGEAPMTGSVAKKVLQMLPKSQRNDTENHNLTNREFDILQLLVKGFSYKIIASDLFISIDTVRFHIKKIYEKLQVHSATEAVSKAIRNRWT